MYSIQCLIRKINKNNTCWDKGNYQYLQMLKIPEDHLKNKANQII